MLPTPPDPDEPTGSHDRDRRPFARDGRRPPFAPPPGLLVLRAAIVALALGIGIVLLSRGDVLLGVLLVTIAALRLAMVVTMRRRRAQWRDARGRGPGASPRRPG